MLPQLFVLYGSQTGNSECISKELANELLDREIDCRLMPLNDFKEVSPPRDSQHYLLVIVCSTTGNGEAPENADRWWRSVKLRSVAKDRFAKHQFMVLGLGDSNYFQFCQMGKAIDKRLAELGAQRIAPLVCADEAIGLEDTVEEWKTAAVTLLEQIYTFGNGRKYS